MEYMGLNEIRERFLTFFEGKTHYRMKSASLVPQNDKSLLLINSGMAPLKPYFTGRETPPSKRVTTCQKCIRTKDIDVVGTTSRHGSFFEMLGNFSFGDYFKKEIIPWAWEFMTEELKIPPERLFVSVYLEDDEAFDIWNKDIGLPEDKITRLGKDDNFWEVGTGPCGPSSEIYFDRGPKYGCGSEKCGVGCDCDRFIEIWNLVFTQFDKTEDGRYEKLRYPNIDTGMGLERVSAVMQNENSLFDVDTLKAIRDRVCAFAGVIYNESAQKDVSVRIITDHIRSVTFMTADGVLPSNEGTGYVLRRLLRRAAMRGKLLGVSRIFLAELAETVIGISKEAYPELGEKKDYILKVILAEENRFDQTISQGLELLKNLKASLTQSGKNILPGKDAFKLYDTFGFPIELTREILQSEGLDTDDSGFSEEMRKQKERAREAREESNYMGSAQTVYNSLTGIPETEFLGYDCLEVKGALILTLTGGDKVIQSASLGEEVSVILDKTAMYAQSGGQLGDSGTIRGESFLIEVLDCVKTAGNRYAHIGKVTRGQVRTGDKADVSADAAKRTAVSRNHTATHLLQKALREVCGSHAEQAGSQVSPERLRFDFTHFAPLTDAEISRAEDLVNQKIFEGLTVTVTEMPIEEARKKGAMALFGEKYKDVVRVVEIGGYSTELCGGTHLTDTRQAHLFKILSESGISSGVRRIEAITGEEALNYYKNLDVRFKHIGKTLKTSPDSVVSKIENLMSNARSMSSEIEKLKAAASGGIADGIIRGAFDAGGVRVIAANAGKLDINALRLLGDRVRDKFDGVILLAAESDGKVSFIATANEAALKLGIHCGEIVKAAAAVTGGSGGGKPGSAQAGGKDASKINAALENSVSIIAKALKEQR